MPERAVTIRISATDSFSSVLQQYNRAIGGAEAQTARSSRGIRGNLDQLNSAMGILNVTVAGLSVAKVIDLASELNNLGAQRTQVEALFKVLSGEGTSGKFLSDLQEATGGIVDDVALMSGSAQLMRMGLADSNEEVVRLIELAVRLKKPTDTASDAIDNFSLLLANQSVLRLDSFGISSARVRDRINELLETGQALNREEAFKMAVLEEGSRQLDRLGNAAHAAETPMARLQTTIQNIASQFGQRFNTGLESTIGLLQVIGQYGVGALSDPGTAGENFRRNQQASSLSQFFGREGQRVQFGYTGALNIQATEPEAVDAAYRRIIDSAARYEEITGRTARTVADIQVGYNDIAGHQQPLLETQQQLSREFLTWRDYTRMDRGALSQVLGDPTEMATTIMYSERLRDTLTDAVNSVRDGALSAVDMANEWVRAADAAERMSLADVFGTEGGGRLGEITDAIMRQAREGGMGEGNLEQLRRIFDLASGRETTSSLAFQDILLPALAQIGGTNPYLALQSAQSYSGLSALLAQMGISPDIIAQNTLGLAGLTNIQARTRGLPGQMTRDAGEGVGQVMYGETDAQAVFDRIVGITGDINTDMDGVAESSGAFRDAIADAHDDLMEMVKNAKTITLDFAIGNMPPLLAELLGLISGGGLAAAMAGATRDNGGTPPGSTTSSATTTRSASTRGNTRNR